MSYKIKKIIALTLLALLGILPLVGEENSIEDLSPCCCIGDFQFRATLFYLQPNLDQNSFVITSTDNRFGGEVFPNGKRHMISTEYKPGFRLETINDLCNQGTLLNLRFTCFNCHPHSHKKGSFLFDTLGYPGDGAQAPEDTTYAGRAFIKQHYQYYGADATINRYIFDWCPDNLSFLFGLHYAYIRVKERFASTGSFINDSTTQTVNNRLKNKSRFWGIGPEIGIDYSYLFQIKNCTGCFGLNLNLRGILLGSTTDVKMHYKTERTGSLGVRLKNDSLLRVNPACDAQIGIVYSYTSCEREAFVEFGWEFVWYSKAVDKITSYDVAYAGNTLDILDDLCLQGPFLRVNIKF